MRLEQEEITEPKGLNLERVAEEIRAKVDDFEGKMGSFMSEFNLYSDAWKMGRPEKSNKLGLTNTRTAETFRATETLATMIHRMWNSSDPNFEFLPGNDTISPENALAAQEIVRKQKKFLRYSGKELLAARIATLCGTVAVYTPFASRPRGAPRHFMEGTDFLPKSLLQVGFERSAWDLNEADWVYITDFVTRASLIRLIQETEDDGQVWDRSSIDVAFSEMGDSKKMDSKVVQRLNSAGYNLDGKSAPAEIVMYYGTLDEANDGLEYCVFLLNRRHVIRIHDGPSYGMRPVRITRFISTELEPLGFGVGKIGQVMQSQLDKNRNRIHDSILFSHYHPWLVNRSAGIRAADFKLQPWKIIPADDISEGAVRELRISGDSIQYGLKLEDMIKQDFRVATGATENLQAIVTEATATESSLAQSEAVRRVGVLAEVMHEEMQLPHLYMMHQNNYDYLDAPIWLKLSGREKPILFDPLMDLPEMLNIESKVTTEKDFRPNRGKRLIEALQIMSSIRNVLPKNINILPFVEELALALRMDPRKVVLPDALPIQLQAGGQNEPSLPPEQAEELPGQPEEGPDSTTAATPVEQGNTGGMNVPLVTSSGEILNG